VSAATDLRDLAAWASYASEWLDEAAAFSQRGDGGQLAVLFDDDEFAAFRTGLRKVPDLIDSVADVVERRPRPWCYPCP
jgi:hypothetical protein